MHITDSNEIILSTIARSLKKEIPAGTSYTENYDPITKSIEIIATPPVIKLLDSFLLKNRIVAEKNSHTLTIK